MSTSFIAQLLDNFKSINVYRRSYTYGITISITFSYNTISATISFSIINYSNYY